MYIELAFICFKGRSGVKFKIKCIHIFRRTRLVILYWFRKREYLLLVSENDLPAHEILVFIALLISEGSDMPAHPNNLARAFATIIHKTWK